MGPGLVIGKIVIIPHHNIIIHNTAVLCIMIL